MKQFDAARFMRLQDALRGIIDQATTGSVATQKIESPLRERFIGALGAVRADCVAVGFSTAFMALKHTETLFTNVDDITWGRFGDSLREVAHIIEYEARSQTYFVP